MTPSVSLANAVLVGASQDAQAFTVLELTLAQVHLRYDSVLPTPVLNNFDPSFAPL